MYIAREELLTEAELRNAWSVVKKSPLGVRRTPCLLAADTNEIRDDSAPGLDFFDTCHEVYPSIFKPLPSGARIHLKLENFQRTGSFKIRGISAQIEEFIKIFGVKDTEGNFRCREFVTMSAGNYGRAVAYAAHKLGLKGTVIMPMTAPDDRSAAIQSYGLSVQRLPTAELTDGVAKHEAENGSIFLHSFDDLTLISGHGSLGFEIVEDVPDVDVVLVCCGGGGLLAGVAAGIRAAKPGVIIYGVEPETACGVYRSFQSGKAEQCPDAKSVASGLAPPYAGENAFRHIKEYVKGIILVTEDELKASVRVAFNHGVVVEAAGAAGLAALLTGKLEKEEEVLHGKNIVVVVTGGNVTTSELDNICRQV